MATRQMSEVIQHLRRSVLPREGAGLTDGQLLEEYLRRRDEAALSALMRRHGPMVWGVCCRILHNHHDAEDAFQATFLVLFRKASSIVPREMVANFLYGVASQTALKARAMAAKRGARERQVTDVPERDMREPDFGRDLRPILDQELGRLPDKYRVAIVLCDLEGMTRKEAARQLRCPAGTVASRLATARRMLAQRLARHGLGLSGGLLGAALAQSAASACVPPSAVSSTIKAANLFAAGQAATPSVISAPVVALMEGVMRTMLLNKLSVAAAVLLGVVMVGGGSLAYHSVVMGKTPQERPGPSETAQSEGQDRRAHDAQGSGRVKTPDEEYKELDREYEEGAREIGKATQAAKTAEEREALLEKHNQRRAKFARRFLELAERDPKHPIGWDAAMWVRNNARDLPEMEAAAALMAEHHPFHKYMGGAVGTLVEALPEPKGVELARTVMERHPDHQARGLACLALARHWKRQANLARRCQEEPKRAAEVLGRERAEQLRKKDAGTLAKEAERMYELAGEKYGDAQYGKSGTLAEVAKRELSILRNAPKLVVGKVAPETEGKDIDGKPMKLSDHRGKVVVVSFWATWCPPCMQMVPQERDLVKQLEGNLFVLLGVNNDEDKDREKVKERVEKEQIIWRSWWDGGPTGPIATRWCVEGWPTVYVLDARGEIRYKGALTVSDGTVEKSLEEAVEALLKEIEIR